MGNGILVASLSFLFFGVFILTTLVVGIIGFGIGRHLNKLERPLPDHVEFYDSDGNLIPGELLYVTFQPEEETYYDDFD